MRVIIPESARKNNNRTDSDSVISKRHDNDCLPCRLLSGCGVIGIGGYIYLQSKHRPAGIGRSLIISTALVTTYIGIARLAEIYPFDKK